jgi:hypothetical protein
VAYATFDTLAIHGIPGIKDPAQAGSEMVPPLVRYDLNLWISGPFEGATYLPR